MEMEMKKTRKPRAPKVQKADKPKRAPSAYAQFVKANYSKVKDVPAKERFKKLGSLWRDQKAK
jgi:hypothetical protein